MKKLTAVFAVMLAMGIVFTALQTACFADDDMTGKWDVDYSYGASLYVDEVTNDAVFTVENMDTQAGKITMILAFYDANGKMIKVVSKTELAGIENELKLPVTGETETIKGFVFDALTGIPVYDWQESSKTDD